MELAIKRAKDLSESRKHLDYLACGMQQLILSSSSGNLR
jgi:hypothetical protein